MQKVCDWRQTVITENSGGYNSECEYWIGEVWVMSTPNARTRQLSLTEVLQEGFTGFSVLSSNSESVDPNEPLKTAKTSARRPRKRHQPTWDTPNPQTTKKVNQQKTPPKMDITME